MFRSRAVLTAALTASVAAALFAWTVYEAREQRRTVEGALLAQAHLLAESLAPGLSAASMASHELDEIFFWKLLDNARLLGEIYVLDPEVLDHFGPILEANGLDTVLLLDEAGGVIGEFGEPADAELLPKAREFLAGTGDEMILGTSLLHDVEHLGAITRIAGGGAVLVRVEGPTVITFADRLGVESLISRLVGVGGLLYLGYYEEPSGNRAEASWDGAPLPPEEEAGRSLRKLGEESVYEARVFLEIPGGNTAWLRVGLDGAPLVQAANSAMQRTRVMGTVLTLLVVLGTGFAAVTRMRNRERELSAERLARVEAARRRSERLAAAGTLAAGLAHEVRSPLNAIGLAGQRLERRMPEGAERKLAARIKTEVGRLEQVLQSFLDLARPADERRESTELGRLCSEVVELLRVEAEQKGVRLEGPDESASADVDPEAMRRALLNLVRNAIEASSEGGRIRLVVDRDRETVTIRVLDDGTGVPEEIRDRAFEAFVSGRPSGTGLGLALVRRIAEEHGGEVSLSNRRPRGAEAVLRLPLRTGAPR